MPQNNSPTETHKTGAIVASTKEQEEKMIAAAMVDPLKEVARTLSKSKLIPKSLQNNPADVWIVLVTGQELGISPMRALQNIHIVDGKVQIGADLIVAICMSSSQCEYFQLVESTNEIATYETKRTDQPNPTKLSFTIEEAKLAGLVGKDNWKKYPSAMLRNRAKSYLGREAFPDIVMGIHDPDELDDLPATEVVDAAPIGSGVEGLKTKLLGETT